MRIFLTGGHGFVGRYLQADLKHAGHEVVAPRRKDVDIQDPESVRSAVAGAAPDAIAHLAAVSFAPDAAHDPVTALRTNVGGTIGLLEAARRLPRPPVILVAGSADVYGTPNPSDLPLREDVPLRPTTPYALSKAAQEAVALGYAARYELPVVVVRAFNHSGPGQRDVFVIPALAERVRSVARGDTDIVRVGNTRVRRDFTHVEDIAVAYRLAMEALAFEPSAMSGKVFNVGSGSATSIEEILTILFELARVPPRIVVDAALSRQDDAPELRCDSGAFRKATGWDPIHSLRDLLTDVYSST